MKKNYNVANNGYAVIDGELRKVSFTDIRTDGDEHVIYTIRGIDGTFTDIKTYASIGDFEKCLTTERSVSIEHGYQSIINGDGTCSAWRMIDGEPQNERLWLNAEIEVNRSTFEPIFPNGYYKSREECLKHSTYVEVKEDGTKVEHMGIVKKLELTNEQRAFLRDVLEPTFAKAAEMGIRLMYNSCYDSVKAVNTNNLRGHLACNWGPCEEATETYSDVFEEVKISLDCDGEATMWYDEI